MFSLQTIFGSGKQFYSLLDAAAAAAHESARALHQLTGSAPHEAGMEAIKLARQRARAASDRISHALVDSFITPFEREDIEELRSALYRIPKQVERFADRYAFATQHLQGVDFVPRAAMLEQAAGIVVDMVRELPRLRMEPIKALNESLHTLETDADRLLLEFYREIYAGEMDARQMFLLKEFYEIMEKAIDRCRDAGVVVYQITLKSG